MFTGIITSIGTLQAIVHTQDCLHFSLNTPLDLSDAVMGESIAVNGVCLTITELTQSYFNVTVVPQTLSVTNLGQLKIGDRVNLERPLKTSGYLHGHYVQGHVDGLGEITAIESEGQALKVTISTSSNLAKYIVDRGYIALDGMSITVIEAKANWFKVTFIPHTQLVTIINQYQVGSQLNVEVDIISKYVEKILRSA